MGVTSLHNIQKNFDYHAYKAKEEDALDIVSIVNEAFKSADFFRKENLDRLTLKDVHQSFENSREGSWYILKDSIDKTKRAAATVLYQSENKSTAFLHMFATRQDLRGHGIGRILLSKIEQQALSENKTALKLWCANVPNLVRYYEKAGFQKTGKEDIYNSAYLKEDYVGKISIVEMNKNLKEE